jgi:hypothetical protein
MRIKLLAVVTALTALLMIACGGGGKREPAATGAAALGQEVPFKDCKWIVLDAKDMGKTLKPNNPFERAAVTEGRFILVHFKVTNTTKEEHRLLSTPKVLDSEGREFKELDRQNLYVPKDQKAMTLEALPAGVTKEFSGVYEVPADAKGLRFQTRDLTTFINPPYKLVEVGF